MDLKPKHRHLGCPRKILKALWWVPWAGVRVGQGQPQE